MYSLRLRNAFIIERERKNIYLIEYYFTNSTLTAMSNTQTTCLLAHVSISAIKGEGEINFK